MGGDSHGASHGHGHGHGHSSSTIKHPVIFHEIATVHHVDMSKFKVPDWREYKVENTVELKEVQQKLAAKGLKDPWLRNHVWRYDPKYGFVKPRTLFFRTLFTGWKYGLAAFVVVAALETGYKKLFGSKDDHHHNSHHEHGSH